MNGEPVIPAPLDDDDDDVAWALQTAAIQWQRGQRADAVVWLRRAVDAAISAGDPSRTQDLTRLAAAVADRLIAEALAAPDSMAPPPRSAPPPDDGSDVDDLLTADSLPPPPQRQRASAHSLTGEIPVDFDDSDADADYDDEAPTIPPSARPLDSSDLDSDDEHDVSPDELFSARPSQSSDIESLVTADEIFSARPPQSSDIEALVTADDVFSYRPGETARSPGSSEPAPVPATTVISSEPRAPLPEPVKEALRLASAVPQVSSVARTNGHRSPVEPDVEPVESIEPEAAESEPVESIEPEPVESERVESIEPDAETEPQPLIVGGISLDQVRGFEDLPEAAQQTLAACAVLTQLSADEEVGSFGAALVTSGRVGIMPAIADVSASIATSGEVVFTRGTLDDSAPLRVVGLEDGTVVASWSTEDIAASMADCPWVADELRSVADRFQALAGAVLGPLGDRLDDALRELVTSRLDVKVFGAGETIVTAGKVVPGLHVVGAGRVEILNSDGTTEDVSPGDFLFAPEVLSAGKAKATARAGKSGALILFAPRGVAHELMMSVPPLLEILSS